MSTEKKIHRLISRSEAADLLCCEEQTVSNWVNNGVITGHMKNGRLFVDSQTILDLFDTAQDVARSEWQLKRLQKKYDKKKDELQQAINTKMCELRLYNHSAIGKITCDGIYSFILSYRPLLTEVEISIIQSMIEHRSVNAVAATFDLSPARILQILHKSIKKLATARRYDDMMNEIDSLKHTVTYLKEKLALCNVKPEGVEADEIVLKRKLVDTVISVRALNCLRWMEIRTVAELVSLKKSELIKIRNFGKKTLRELEELVDSLGLEFGMDIPDYLRSKEFNEYFNENIKKYR